MPTMIKASPHENKEMTAKALWSQVSKFSENQETFLCPAKSKYIPVEDASNLETCAQTLRISPNTQPIQTVSTVRRELGLFLSTALNAENNVAQ